MKTVFIVNPAAGKGISINRLTEEIKTVSQRIGSDTEVCLTECVGDARSIAEKYSKESPCRFIVCGGDGTLSEVVNGLIDNPMCEVGVIPCGTGNDFAHDLGHGKNSNPFPIDEYIKNLPKVRVKNKTYRFINGVGYGIDGYCCEVGDALKKLPGKKVNYAAIAIKGLLFHYKPTNARVTVDGKTATYKKVWIAPTMNGRFYGGGMMPTPDQKRNSGKLSAMIFHGSGKLKTLMIFPSLFKGEHVKHTKHVEILTGNEITVEFDRPVALQIDGETILGVSSYTAAIPTCVPSRDHTMITAARR